MRTNRLRVTILIWALFSIPVLSYSVAAQSGGQRPIELADILAWKSIRAQVVSADGQWFAYQLTPTEGDSEVVLKSITGDKESRFPIGQLPVRGAGAGESPRGGAGGPAMESVSFSDDSRWLAFFSYPAEKDAKKLRKQRKPIYNKVVLVELATGDKTEFEKIKRFSFSGERGTWLALHRYPSESQAREKWTGSDLILLELATRAQTNVGNVSEFNFDKKGQWLALTIDAQDKIGNGVQLRDMTTGAVRSLDSDKAVYKRPTWTEKGDAFAVLKGVEDKKYEGELYSVLGFTGLTNASPQKVAFNPASDSSFPKEMSVSPNRNPEWTEPLDGILFGIHDLKKKEEKKGEEAAPPEVPAAGARDEAANQPDEDKPDLTIWHWQDKRLQAQQQVEANADKNFSYLCIYRVPEKKFIRLADDNMRRVTPAPKHRFAIGLDSSEYELMSNLDGRRYEDVYVVDLATGTRKLAVKKCRWYYSPSFEGTHFLYYDDGNFFVYDMTNGQSRNVTQNVPTSFIDKEDDHNVVKPPVRPIGWVKGGDSVLLSDNWDIWRVPIAAGTAVNLTVNGKKENIRYRRYFRLDPEEKGIDLSGPLYLDVYAEYTKKGGILRLDGGKPSGKMLVWDDAVFSTMLKPKKADMVFYTVETFEKGPDYYVADASLQGGKKITDSNPQQKDFLWSKGSKIIDYTSVKGDKLQGSLFLPANYEAGKSYPTMVYIYEKLTNGHNRYYTPTANGFNKSVYTSNGYAVLMPDIVYKVNDPGMSAVWCVVPAVQAAIATGIVDKDKIAIHGHSWGGYQTAFLITQTDIFHAAIAGAPLTNMISMYSSIYWNTGSANQAIFESSQGRFTGGPWEIPEAYVRNSPVYFAKNIKTPLLLLHNDKDGAVDWNQGVTYYNTIRRMQKPVIWLEYRGENHGLAKPANQKDYTVRMKEFLDYYLKGKPAPRWIKEGVSWLKIDDELKERATPAKP